MDPLQTLRDLLSEMASEAPNISECVSLTDELLGWFTSGGYIPRITKQGEQTYLILDTTEDITVKTVVPGEGN